MNHVKQFRDFFKSIPDYRKLVLLKFAIKNDVDMLCECGY